MIKANKLLNSSYVTKKTAVIITSAFLLAGCIEKEKIAKVPDAENILFASDGTLIVSGGKNIYRINSSTSASGETEYSSEELYNGNRCAFAGIAQSGDWIFTSCAEIKFEWKGFIFSLRQDNHLLAANINDPSLEFKIISDENNDPLDALAIPNGMAFTPTGQLAIADENFFAQSSVGLITLDYSSSEPRVASFEPDWLGAEFGVQSPNGVRYEDNTLYVSDSNKVRRFEFDVNGNIPLAFTNTDGEYIDNGPNNNVMYTGSLIIDDIMPYCGGIAVTHFLEGQVVYQDKNGDKYSTLPFAFEAPSALAIGNGPLFSGNDLMVSEKGVLFETSSNIGNHITRVPMDFDLNDPHTCAAIEAL